jgi:hypothetical protein
MEPFGGRQAISDGLPLLALVFRLLPMIPGTKTIGMILRVERRPRREPRNGSGWSRSVP